MALCVSPLPHREKTALKIPLKTRLKDALITPQRLVPHYSIDTA